MIKLRQLTTTLKKVMKVTVDSATFVISSFVIKVPYPCPINIPANIKFSFLIILQFLTLAVTCRIILIV